MSNHDSQSVQACRSDLLAEVLLPFISAGCVCEMFGDKGHRLSCETRTEAARAASALTAAGVGVIADAKTEALREAATWVIGCEHVTAMKWCGICDHWRAALEAEAVHVESEARRR